MYIYGIDGIMTWWEGVVGVEFGATIPWCLSLC